MARPASPTRILSESHERNRRQALRRHLDQGQNRCWGRKPTTVGLICACLPSGRGCAWEVLTRWLFVRM